MSAKDRADRATKTALRKVERRKEREEGKGHIRDFLMGSQADTFDECDVTREDLSHTRFLKGSMDLDIK